MIRCIDVRKLYRQGDNEITALAGVTMEIPRGAFAASASDLHSRLHSAGTSGMEINGSRDGPPQMRHLSLAFVVMRGPPRTEDCINVRLTTLTGNFVLYFPKVNWVHNNDIIGTAFAQK